MNLQFKTRSKISLPTSSKVFIWSSVHNISEKFGNGVSTLETHQMLTTSWWKQVPRKHDSRKQFFKKTAWGQCFLQVFWNLQLQNRTCKARAICRRDIAGVSNMFETRCNFAATKIASSCRDKNRLCKRALKLRPSWNKVYINISLPSSLRN